MTKGFSLLEVIVALALLAISFTSLILVEARAINMAQKANMLSIATGLIKTQLLECKKIVAKEIASTSDFSLTGDFSDIGHADFSYECHAPKFSMHAPSESKVEAGLKKKAQKTGNDNIGASNQMASPFISMITDSLGNALRELTVIVRWKDNAIEDEIRVVTHVIDLAPLSMLSRSLAQGIDSLPKEKKKTKKEDKSDDKLQRF